MQKDDNNNMYARVDLDIEDVEAFHNEVMALMPQCCFMRLLYVATEVACGNVELECDPDIAIWISLAQLYGELVPRHPEIKDDPDAMLKSSVYVGEYIRGELIERGLMEEDGGNAAH